MFSLKKFLVGNCIFKLACFCKSWVYVSYRGYVSRKVYLLKIFEQIGIGMAYLHILTTMHKIDTAAEIYLEPFPI